MLKELSTTSIKRLVAEKEVSSQQIYKLYKHKLATTNHKFWQQQNKKVWDLSQLMR